MEIVSDKKKVTAEELSMLQAMNTTFINSKMALGDLELKKQSLLKEIDDLKVDFAKNEQALIGKYGMNSVINIQTGEITEKKENG
jgi:hypothetical protein